MSLFLQLMRLMTRRAEFRLLVFLVLLHFSSFWVVLRLTEAPDAVIVEPINFWYFWATTTLTIGYGDLSPQSIGGRAIAPFFQLTGIVLLTVLLTLCVNTLNEFSAKRRKGLMATTKTKHILLVGDFHPLKTRTLLKEAVADWNDGGRTPSVVGCFRNTGDRNPFDRDAVEKVHPEYVQAANGFNRAILLDAGVEHASEIYVFADDDTTAIGIVSIMSRLTVSARVVLLLQEEANVESVPEVDLDLHVIPPIQAVLAVREMGDPGTNVTIRELLSSGGPTIYSVALTEASTSYADAKHTFGTLFPNTILIGYCRMNTDGTWKPELVTAAGDAQIGQGDCLVYLATHDLSDTERTSFNRALAA